MGSLPSLGLWFRVYGGCIFFFLASGGDGQLSWRHVNRPPAKFVHFKCEAQPSFLPTPSRTLPKSLIRDDRARITTNIMARDSLYVDGLAYLK